MYVLKEGRTLQGNSIWEMVRHFLSVETLSREGVPQPHSFYPISATLCLFKYGLHLKSENSYTTCSQLKFFNHGFCILKNFDTYQLIIICDAIAYFKLES